MYQAQRNCFSKFWWLDKSQRSSGTCDAAYPYQKEPCPLTTGRGANGCGAYQQTKVHAGLQAPSVSQVPSSLTFCSS